MYIEDYKKHLKGEWIDGFWKDAMEFRETMRFAYDILNRETPAAGASHDWNAARSAMSMHMDAYERAFDEFMANKSEESAKAFDLASQKMEKPLQMARNAIFASNCKRNWLSVKYKYGHLRGEDVEGGMS